MKNGEEDKRIAKRSTSIQAVDDRKFNTPIAISALERLAEKGYTERTKKMLGDTGIALEVF